MLHGTIVVSDWTSTLFCRGAIADRAGAVAGRFRVTLLPSYGVHMPARPRSRRL
jgi:hypothetical protein